MGFDWKGDDEAMRPMRRVELAAERRGVMGEMGNARMAPKSVMLAEGFEGMAEALEAKRRLMTLWKGDGLDFTAAVLRYADEFSVPTGKARERVEDMELLTGVRLERVAHE
jgi:hypothetical protein